jgi:ATP citrate (pro-S)-lyase
LYFLLQVQIWVRRAGPNYQEGLQLMRETANSTGLPIHIYGPETHVTAVVPLALGLATEDEFPEFDDERHQMKVAAKKSGPGGTDRRNTLQPQKADHEADHKVENFTAATRCVVYGLQHRAVQGMLDFDYMCKREKPSVAAMIFPFSSNHYIKVRSHATKQILIDVSPFR